MASKSDSVRTRLDGKLGSLRMRGGTTTESDSVGGEAESEDVEGRNRGEAGMIVVEKGDGAEGGGRWMKVTPSGNVCTVAFGLEVSGSMTFGGGFTGRRVAYVRENRENRAHGAGVDSRSIVDAR